MKNWINKNYRTLIITAFLIPIITVAVVSISHVTKWYGISNPISWAVYLSIGIEIAALSALAAISADMGKKVYFPFIVVTLIQFIGNIYFAYSYIDITSTAFKDWVDLVSPLVSFMGVEPNDMVGHKRFLALFAGGMLPIISLSFLHMLVKFTEEDRKKEIENESNAEIQAKDLMAEVSRIRLSESDLKKLEDALLNPQPPNENLKKASEEYSNSIVGDEENNFEYQPTAEEESENFLTINLDSQNIFQETIQTSPTPTPTETGTPTPTPTPTETGTPTPTPTYIDKINVIAREKNFFNAPAEGYTDGLVVNDNFTIGHDDAYEMTDEILEQLLQENNSQEYPTQEEKTNQPQEFIDETDIKSFITIEDVKDNLKNGDLLFPDLNEQAKEIVENSNLDEILNQTQTENKSVSSEEDEKKNLIKPQQESLGTIISETPTSEFQDFKENLYWETLDETNPNQIIYDLENDRVIIPTSEEEIISPTPTPVPQKIISRNVNPRRRNFR